MPTTLARKTTKAPNVSSPSHSLTRKSAKLTSDNKRRAPELNEDGRGEDEDDDSDEEDVPNEPAKKRQSRAPATSVPEPEKEDSSDDSDDAPEEIGGNEVELRTMALSWHHPNLNVTGKKKSRCAESS